MTWKSLGETDVRITPDYQFRIEEFRDAEDHQMVFVHLTVSKWTPEVFKDMVRHWTLFRKCVTCPLYAIGGVDDTDKWEHFVSLLRFRPILEKVICENGQERRLFVHTIKNKNNEQPIVADDKLQSKHELQRHSSAVERPGPVPDVGVPERR